MNVIAVQFDLAWEDRKSNFETVHRLLSGVSVPSGSLIVLPEMFSTGFTMASSEMAERMEGPTVSWLRERASALGKTLCGSLVIEEQGCFYNRFLWVTPEGGGGPAYQNL